VLRAVRESAHGRTRSSSTGVRSRSQRSLADGPRGGHSRVGTRGPPADPPLHPIKMPAPRSVLCPVAPPVFPPGSKFLSVDAAGHPTALATRSGRRRCLPEAMPCHLPVNAHLVAGSGRTTGSRPCAGRYPHMGGDGRTRAGPRHGTEVTPQHPAGGDRTPPNGPPGARAAPRGGGPWESTLGTPNWTVLVPPAGGITSCPTLAERLWRNGPMAGKRPSSRAGFSSTRDTRLATRGTIPSQLLRGCEETPTPRTTGLSAGGGQARSRYRCRSRPRFLHGFWGTTLRPVSS
jgi:hypothetical protein